MFSKYLKHKKSNFKDFLFVVKFITCHIEAIQKCHTFFTKFDPLSPSVTNCHA